LGPNENKAATEILCHEFAKFTHVQNVQIGIEKNNFLEPDPVCTGVWWSGENKNVWHY